MSVNKLQYFIGKLNPLVVYKSTIIRQIKLGFHSWFAWSCKSIFGQIPNSTFWNQNILVPNKTMKIPEKLPMDIVSPELTIQFYWGHLKKHHKCRIRRQTDLGCLLLALSRISLFLFPRIVKVGIVLALETLTQDVPWPQEWLLTKSQDWQS